MYEVFINDRPLIISNNISIDNDVIIFNDDINWFEIVSSLINKSKKCVYIKTKSLDFAWQSFLNQFKIIKAAGGIVTTWKNEDPKKAGDIICSANKSLHDKILKILKPIS